MRRRRTSAGRKGGWERFCTRRVAAEPLAVSAQNTTENEPEDRAE